MLQSAVHTDNVVITTGTTLIPVQTNAKRLIRNATFFNSSNTATIKVTVYRFGTGESPVDATTVFEMSILPRRCYVASELVGKLVPGNHLMEATADTVGSVIANIDGYLDTN